MRLPVNRNLPLAALLLLSACGGGASVKDVPSPAPNGPAADYPVVIGAPFVIDGVTFTPVDTMNYDAVGVASVGADGGSAISAAHRTLPLPSYVEVTALDSGKTTLVRIERRGPMSGSSLIELSPGAAAQLGLIGPGRNGVRVRRVNPPEADRALLRQGQPAPLRMDTPKSLLVVLQRKLDQQMGIVDPPPAPIDGAAVIPVPPPPMEPKGTKPSLSLKKPIKPVEKPAPPASRPEAAKPAVPRVEKPSSTTVIGSYFVQVGSFASKPNADAAAKKAGGAAVQSGKLWRVRVGPFADADTAAAALAKAKAAGYSDARVQRAN